MPHTFRFEHEDDTMKVPGKPSTGEYHCYHDTELVTVTNMSNRKTSLPLLPYSDGKKRWKEFPPHARIEVPNALLPATPPINFDYGPRPVSNARPPGE